MSNYYSNCNDTVLNSTKHKHALVVEPYSIYNILQNSHINYFQSWKAHFLKIVVRWPVAGVCLVSRNWSCPQSVYMCLPSKLVITSDMMWTPYGWLNKFYSFHMATVVGIISRHDLTIMVHLRNHCSENLLHITWN